ncbi:retron Se72 family effector protein [Paraburkholderia agricolaris]|uniref:retron Se72 family effector protein n=1 Tax=Paraburkholderia agricolaris TaxID=2152888 RepID=UPI0012918E74|nr:retron Se72 family effector protein [Paraburkholderia agricolaris]
MTSQSSELNYGTIKAYYAFKGFGFITREKGKDVFFYFKDVREESDIFEGAKVSFNIVNEGRGPMAKCVTRVG